MDGIENLNRRPIGLAALPRDERAQALRRIAGVLSAASWGVDMAARDYRNAESMDERAAAHRRLQQAESDAFATLAAVTQTARAI